LGNSIEVLDHDSQQSLWHLDVVGPHRIIDTQLQFF